MIKEIEYLEFAKYYDVTKQAKKYSEEYDMFEKVYICVDTWDFWIARVQKGYNKEYDREDGKWLLERNKIEKPSKGFKLKESTLKIVFEEDEGFDNWDNEDYDNLDELIEDLDAGFGIGEIQ